MKRFAILIASMICSCSVFGRTGPYVGMGLGYSQATMDLAVAATIKTAVGAETHYRIFQGKPRGVQGRLVAGYGYDINKFNLATELTAQFPEIKYSKVVNREDDIYYKFCYAYGVDLVPSYYITRRSSIYLKVGITRGRFASKDIVNNEPPNAWDISFHVTGFDLGLGGATYLNKNLRMRLEYLYTNYQTHEFLNVINMPAPPPIIYRHLEIDGKLHPKIHTVMLEIDYQFDSS